MKKFIILTAILLSPCLPAATLFVSSESTNPVLPFSSWATAATNVQQAVDAAAGGDEILVTNGIYSAVTVEKPLLLLSINGPKVTIIDPARRGRCAWLTNGASLSGFWLRHGAAGGLGGGVFCASTNVFLTNCVITDNSVDAKSERAPGNGGGAFAGTLYNCVVASNSAAMWGGGAIASTLYNCTVIGNHAAGLGGGVYGSIAINSIIYSNTAKAPFGNHCRAHFSHCCTTPMPANGVGSITTAPEFINYATGDLRLLGISPCIDAGDNNMVRTEIDMAGNPRIVRGKVDIGAYEFPGTNSIVFYAWVQHHGVLIDGTTDYEDPDGDGMNNWQEWVCYTCPTNSANNLRLVSAVPEGRDVVVRWKSSVGVKYLLERGTGPSSPFMLIASNLLGQSSEFVFTDRNVPGAGPFYYRVGVKPPPPTPGPIVWAIPLRAQAERSTALP